MASLQEFCLENNIKSIGQDKFELINSRTLIIALNGKVWIRVGSMIAYDGRISFVREGVMEHGFGRALKKTFTGEGVPLTKADGQGDLILAESAKFISLIDLKGEEFVVAGANILAFEDSLNWDISLMKTLGGVVAGGLFNVKMSGEGTLALTSDGKPIALRVTPNNPIYTDPQGTIAWTGNLEPNIKTDIQFKTLLGRGSGESIQMEFTTETEGYVFIQPSENAITQ